MRADLLVEDGEQLRFRHDLLREATRQSLPQSLRRAMERQSASVMLGMGAAPAEVATQLARSAEPGDREAIDALRQAAQSVGRGDASAAADLSKRALELLPADDAEHGSLVAETVEWLNRASRHGELVGGWARRTGSLSTAAVRWSPATRYRAAWARRCASDWICSPSEASEVVRVAAVLPDRFSAGLLAAMLDRSAGVVDVGAPRGSTRGSSRGRR